MNAREARGFLLALYIFCICVSVTLFSVSLVLFMQRLVLLPIVIDLIGLCEWCVGITAGYLAYLLKRKMTP